jgi:thiol:disulfide interchange protein DsbD
MRLIAALLLVFSGLLHAAEPDLLPPEKAFQFSARYLSGEAIEVRYLIAPGYYMYRDKFAFSVAPATGAALGAPGMPPGKMKRDEFFGDVAIYRDAVTIRVPIKVSDASLRSVALTAVSQGCADVGVCYVPQEQKAEILLTATSGGPAAPASGGLSRLLDQSGGAAGAQDGLVANLFQGEFWLLVASFFGFGLLLAFTPCMLPMVPILSGIIAGRGQHLTKMHGFVLALVYVLGLAITYAVAGVAAGLSGAMLSAALQSPWVLGAFAVIFVALALAMFGFYELQLPIALQSRLADASNQLHGGHFAGVFSMGILSALIVGPCVAAPLAGALLYISQSRDVVLGGSALFAMGLGMGMPLLVVGASAGALLPRAGPWMDTVKRFFGVLLLGVAIYLVTPIIPLVMQMLAWAALLIMTGIYLRAIDPLPPTARGFDKFSKGIGVIALLIGAAFLVGALSGTRDVLQPLSGLRVSSAAAPAAAGATAFKRVNSNAELDAAIQAAGGKPVMLDFYADWCVSCKEMERFTFSDDGVKARFAQMLLVQADVTANTPDHAALLRRFRLFGPPGIIFFDRAGRELQDLRAIGFQPADKFAAMLDQVLAVR